MARFYLDIGFRILPHNEGDIGEIIWSIYDSEKPLEEALQESGIEKRPFRDIETYFTRYQAPAVVNMNPLIDIAYKLGLDYTLAELDRLYPQSRFIRSKPGESGLAKLLFDETIRQFDNPVDNNGVINLAYPTLETTIVESEKTGIKAALGLFAGVGALSLYVSYEVGGRVLVDLFHPELELTTTLLHLLPMGVVGWILIKSLPRALRIGKVLGREIAKYKLLENFQSE